MHIRPRQNPSKEVIAWGDGLINDYLLRRLKRIRQRSPGDEYSRFEEDGLTPKMTQIPAIGLGNPTRDIGHKRSPGDVGEMSSFNQADRDIYGTDVPADDETKPGGGRRISPRGEPPVTTHDNVSLMSGDPVAIRELFNPNRDRTPNQVVMDNYLFNPDEKSSHKTRKHLKDLYDTKPIR